MIDYLGQPSVSKVWNRYGKASANQDAVIEVCVAYNKRQKWMSTRIRVYPHEWDKVHRRVINRLDAIEINKLLDQLVADVREVIYDMHKEGQIDIDTIPARLAAKRKPNLTFFDFLDKQVEIRKHGKAPVTGWRWERFVETFKEWGRIKTFYDLTEQKIIDFDRYLKNQGMKANSRWHNKHKFLNSFIRDAQKAGLIQVNPYDMVLIDKGNDCDGIQKHLTPDEFLQLKAAKMPSERLERVQDLFVFQTYTCLAYKDLIQFNTKRIEEIDGEPTYRGRRGKTKIEFVIPMMPPALEVLKKYNGKLPMLSNVKYNAFLKEVAKEVGIKKPLSTHWARHTGATYYLNKVNLSIEVVSRMLGHATIKETEKTYAYRQPKTVVAALKEKKDII